MGDVIVFKAAQNMHNGVDFADIGKELVAQAFTFGSSAHQTCNINEVDAGRDDFLRACDFRNAILTWIGNRHFASVWFDGAERIVCSLCCGRLGQRVEERGLADVRQADDAAFETHDIRPLSLDAVN